MGEWEGDLDGFLGDGCVNRTGGTVMSGLPSDMLSRSSMELDRGSSGSAKVVGTDMAVELPASARLQLRRQGSLVHREHLRVFRGAGWRQCRHQVQTWDAAVRQTIDVDEWGPIIRRL